MMKELRNLFLKKEDAFTDILGQDNVKNQMKSALIMGRNVIIVGAPGIGKTTLAKNLAKLLKKGKFIRIQGSPDLTVEDLLGDIDPIKAMKYGPLSVEAFTKGKIFKADKGILFFDELNRAPEKLQNALWQVLQEKKATIGSYDVDFDIDFIFIGSLPPEEKVLIKEKQKIKLVKIGDLVDAQIKKNGSVIKNKSEIARNKDHLMALAYNPKRKKIEELEITAFIRHKPTDFIYEISLKKGRKVKVTGKHSVFTGSDKDLIPTEVSKLKISDKIAIPKKIDYKSLNLEKIDLIALLWQTGYLTFDKKLDLAGKVKYKMKVPNLEILNSLNTLFFDYLTDMNGDKGFKEVAISESLLENDFDKFKDTLTSLFASLPYTNYANNIIANHEVYYSSVVYTFRASLGFDVITEDIPNRGRLY